MPSTVRTAADVAESCLDALLALRIEEGGAVGWPAWVLGRPAGAAELAADDVSLYNGDAGIAWALAELGSALGREPLRQLAIRAAERVAANVDTLHGAGLLAGRAGARLAAYRAGVPVTGAWERPAASDLTSGAAGVLLAQVRCGQEPEPGLLRALARSAQAKEVGWAWADPDDPDDQLAVPLCGLAHGASGVSLALAEAAVADPSLGTGFALAVGGLAWESSWFDPLRGWPDLRGDEAEFPVWWCHGAAGITAVRLRLVQLAGRGIDLGMPPASLSAQAHAGVLLCAERVREAAEQAGSGTLPHAGLSLCHGLGGALDALALAAEVTGSPELREEAAASLVALAGALGPDPLAWPCGTPEPGSASLFLGLAGVAVVAARLAWPEAGIASPSLLG